jgi:hypothetical protein
MSDPSAPKPEALKPTGTAPEPGSLFSHRSRKQLSLFFAGASFFALSTLVTRRSVLRRNLATFPSFYHPSNRPPATPVNGAVEALEALGLATVNVASWAMMMTGGLLWAFDISSLHDARHHVRGGPGVDGTGRGGTDVEEEFEEWMATVLDRKKVKEEVRRKRKEDGTEGLEEKPRTGERGKPR